MCRLEFDTFVLLKIFQLICKPTSSSSCLHKIHISKELYRPIYFSAFNSKMPENFTRKARLEVCGGSTHLVFD